MEIEGYFAETDYPPHFPQAFTPAWIDHALRVMGHAPPRSPRGPFRYVDLGCGNGLQTLLMAAGCPEGTFLGTDANDHAMARAQALAEGLGVANVTFRAETFAETLARAERGNEKAGEKGTEPPADYIVGLGLLSWISAENRALLMRLAARLLAPGGAAAFGYNTLPGRAPELLLQRLLLDAARDAPGAQGDAIAAALDRLAALADAGSGSPGLHHPRLRHILAERHRLDRRFLPHEYVSSHWTPLHAEDVIREMERLGLAFSGSLTLVENRLDFVLGRAARAAVAAEADAPRRARLIDLLTDQGFRRDLYVRAGGAVTPQAEARDRAWIAATGPAAEAELALPTPAGRIRFDNRAARGMLEALEASPRPTAEAGAHVARADRLNTLDALTAAGLVVPVEPPANIEADAINRWLADRAAADAPAPRALVTPCGTRQAASGLLRALGGQGRPDRAALTRLGL